MNAPHTATAHYESVAGVPVGGYSISLAKKDSSMHTLAYIALIAMLGIVLSVTKRKRK
jgi:hypothetical protein